MTRAVNIETTITTKHSILLPWLVCFSAALYFFFEFMQVNMFNAINPGLMASFHVDARQVGHISASYFYANVAFLFFAGTILDRVSTRKLIILAMSANIISTLGFAVANAIWQTMLFRGITGIAGAFCFLSCVRLATRWFPPRRLALIIGLIVTFAMTGGLVAQTPFTILVDHFGWRQTLFIDSAVGAIMLFVIIMFVQDYPPQQQYDAHSDKKQLDMLGLTQALRQVLSNTQNWLGGIYTSLMNLPILLLGAIWGSLYLTQVRHLSRFAASSATSMLFLGTIIGCPVIGWLSDRLGARRQPMLIGAMVALLISIALIYTPQLSLTSILLLFFSLGFITSTQIISYPLIAESNPRSLIGSAEGLASTLIMAGGFMQPVFAYLLAWHWQPHYIKSIPMYSPENFKHAMLILPIAFAIAVIAACLLHELSEANSSRSD